MINDTTLLEWLFERFNGANDRLLAELDLRPDDNIGDESIIWRGCILDAMEREQKR